MINVRDRSCLIPKKLTKYVQVPVTALLAITGAHVPVSVIVHSVGYDQGGVSLPRVCFRELNSVLKLRCDSNIFFTETTNWDFFCKPFNCRTATITSNCGCLSKHHCWGRGHGQKAEQT